MSNQPIYERLRQACADVRTKSYPLSDLIPLMQKAADQIEGTEQALCYETESCDQTVKALERARAIIAELEQALIKESARTADTVQRADNFEQRLDMANELGNAAREELAQAKTRIAELGAKVAKWRALAMQFDNQRVHAMRHLKALVSVPKQSTDEAVAFIQSVPKQGTEVVKDAARLDFLQQQTATVDLLVRGDGFEFRIADRTHEANADIRVAIDAAMAKGE